ncbi:MAG: phenylacetate--CoA ligase [Treponema sp.]|uniref:phenylacetate--CoA ligase family protein n=1 Tax=Treponema sp. TaxID=166 RepID=UPI001B73496A|nr:phenylacetate--CoA ligase [Treponema sp.]MBP5587315.1 phenylacetate--CoA ligase [Treponema sp.]MCR5387172.1 phenylacetate--CoA ligase [Treponema sp.]
MSRKYYQEEYETMPRDKIRELQSKRLVEQFKYVYDNVEYYRNRCKEAGVTPDDIKSIDDLDKIPFTCKDDLRATYPYGLFAVPRKEVVRIHASSGTTGKQIVVGYTKGDLDIWDDCAARQLVAVGADEDDIVQDAYGYGLFTGGFGIHGGATKLGCQVIPISSGNTQRQITFMQDLKSTVLCCTPSYAAYLGETLKEMGLTPKDIYLKAGIFGAEPWTEEMRRDIEKSLGLKAYDIYGLTEVLGPGVAFECSEQAGMHVNEDHFIIETIDPKTGKRLPDGEKGELVFTALTKKAFPLMRFRTKDIGVLNVEKCKCGRTFVRMSKPMGRTDDMLIIRGVNVFPSQIEEVLLKQGYAPNYQIIVGRENNTDTFEVKVEMTPEKFSDVIAEVKAQETKLENALLTILQIKAKVTLVAPKTIERSEGKAKRVIDTRKLHG